MWKAIFTGAVCIALALVLGFLGIELYREMPLVSLTCAVAEAGVIFGGLKSVLEITKNANELRKLALDIRKLEFEIEEKKRAAEKADAQIVIATLDEIKQYAVRPLRVQSSANKMAAITTSIVMAMVGGTWLAYQFSWDIMRPSPHSSPEINPRGADKPEPEKPGPMERKQAAARLFTDAVNLEAEEEYCQAESSMKVAEELDPLNREYTAYRIRLEKDCQKTKSQTDQTQGSPK